LPTELQAPGASDYSFGEWLPGLGEEDERYRNQEQGGHDQVEGTQGARGVKRALDDGAEGEPDEAAGERYESEQGGERGRLDGGLIRRLRLEGGGGAGAR